MPPCKMSPDTLVSEVELPGELLDRAAKTPKQPGTANKRSASSRREEKFNDVGG
jgi:hypothetical protein